MVDGHLLHGLVGGLLFDGGVEDVGVHVHGDGDEVRLRARLKDGGGGGDVPGLGGGALGRGIDPQPGAPRNFSTIMQRNIATDGKNNPVGSSQV